MVLEKTLESPLDYKIKSVNSKGNQPWIFIARTDTEAPILWPPDVKNWLILKVADAGKDWREEEKWTREDETVGWYHQLHVHEFFKLQSWWRTGKNGVLQFMGSQKVRYNWGNWTDLIQGIGSHARNCKKQSDINFALGVNSFMNEMQCDIVYITIFFK